MNGLVKFQWIYTQYINIYREKEAMISKKKQSIVFIFNRQTLTEQEKYRERGREKYSKKNKSLWLVYIKWYVKFNALLYIFFYKSLENI